MFRLRSKIVTAFSLVILSGMILMVTMINFSTRSGYEIFIKQNDINYGLSLQEPLARYFSLSGSWDGVEAFLQIPASRFPVMRRSMNHSESDGSRMKNMSPSIVFTDSFGRVLFNTSSRKNLTGSLLEREELKKGVTITVGNEVQAYIFIGSMVEHGLSENEERYLNRTIFIIIAVSLFILVISIVFSYFLSWRISKPVSALTQAVKDIESGDFRKRVPILGADEISELSGSFNKMADSLESNERWRKQIIADSAHELRTPVSLIQGNLEMILDGVYEADSSHIQNIYDETLVLARLIQELQQLYSAESGSMILNMEKLDLNNLLENVINIFHADEVKDQINLINCIDSAFPPIVGDYQKLKQVFSNVLTNAFHHTPSGGSVRLRGEVRGESALIIIEDTGPGIKSDDLEKIFERFYRTDSSRNRIHGGSGLGLSISREILKLHGGTISAESSPGKGAAFYISIPFTSQ